MPLIIKLRVSPSCMSRSRVHMIERQVVMDTRRIVHSQLLYWIKTFDSFDQSLSSQKHKSRWRCKTILVQRRFSTLKFRVFTNGETTQHQPIIISTPPPYLPCQSSFSYPQLILITFLEHPVLGRWICGSTILRYRTTWRSWQTQKYDLTLISFFLLKNIASDIKKHIKRHIYI